MSNMNVWRKCQGNTIPPMAFSNMGMIVFIRCLVESWLILHEGCDEVPAPKNGMVLTLLNVLAGKALNVCHLTVVEFL